MRNTRPSIAAPETVERHKAHRPRGAGFWISRGLLGLGALMVILIAAGAAYQVVATELNRRAFPPPGELVDVGGYRLHISCAGSAVAGSPTVVLESGLANASPVWAWVQPAVATATRVCAYDRAGIGWSEQGPAPRDGQQIAMELHTLLANAKVEGPYVLVGHSVGGLLVRVYAALYPGDVAGMVLVDSSHEDQWTRTPAGQAQYRQFEQFNVAGRVLARLGLVRLLNIVPLSPDLPPRAAAEFKALSETTQSADMNEAEFSAFPATNEQVRRAGRLGAIPLFVLTGTSHETSPELEQLHQEFQRELAALSTNSLQRVVEGATHASLQIDREQSEITSAAILQVVEAARTGRRLVP